MVRVFSLNQYRYFFSVCCFLGFLGGCATTKIINVEQVVFSSHPVSQVASAGAVSVDITPPPGMPMGGYSIMAKKGVGFRTRLKARIIYLNDPAGQAIALVQTDLTASSLLLHHQVSSAVASQTGLRPGDIAITASHSHSAPANFFENDFYNKHMSNKKGLEEDYLAFVTQQISNGIVQAYKNRRPAKIATGSRAIYGYNRNRSLDAYRLNDGVEALDWEDDDAVFKAVNPSLNMIRIDVKNDQNEYLPLAAFSSFSIHATAITPQSDVYNADLFAYAQKDLAWKIGRKYQTDWPVVHAMTTGTQGDMAPALTQRGDNYTRHFDSSWQEARQLGQNIGREAIQLFELLGDKLSSHITLKTAVREINIREQNRIGDVEICKNAAIGSPVVGGAYERRTPWLSMMPFFKAGNIFSRRWFFTQGCQANKSHAGFAFIQPMFEPKDSFPQVVMFQWMRINDVVILPLPFEVTVEAGRRISAVVKETLVDEGVKYVWIAGNANGYFGYTTTVEEYRQQNYEGGHTLYGINSSPYLRHQLVKLTKDVLTQNSVQEILPHWRYAVKINSFYPKKMISTGKRKTRQPPRFHQAKKENYIAFNWLGVGPSEIDFHEALVELQISNNGYWLPLFIDHVPISDEGYDIEVRFIKNKTQGMAEYEARWYNPVPGKNYRFIIKPRKNQVQLNSVSFEYAGRLDGVLKTTQLTSQATSMP